MTTEARPDASIVRLHANDGDAFDLIETEMAVLARALERLQRRSEIYRDLDRASYLIARTVESTGSVSINGLASALGLDATTVTRQVATMEATRLVTRRADRTDGRVTLISLSDIGRRKMRAVQLARKERVARLLGSWSDNDRRELGRLLAKFNDELSGDSADTASAETGHPVRKRSSRPRA